MGMEVDMGIALTVAWKVYYMREDVEHIFQVAAGTMNGVGVAVEVTAREKVAVEVTARGKVAVEVTAREKAAALRQAPLRQAPLTRVTARHRHPFIIVKWSTLDFLSRKCP